MNNQLEKILNLLTYKGPSKQEIISTANFENCKVDMHQQNNLSVIKITSKLPFGKTLIDCYFYNIHDELVKQTATIESKTKVIFDKYTEIQQLMKTNINCKVS